MLTPDLTPPPLSPAEESLAAWQDSTWDPNNTDGPDWPSANGVVLSSRDRAWWICDEIGCGRHVTAQDARAAAQNARSHQWLTGHYYQTRVYSR